MPCKFPTVSEFGIMVSESRGSGAAVIEIATLAVLDTKPRYFDNSGLSVLQDLAQLVIGELERPKGA